MISQNTYFLETNPTKNKNQLIDIYDIATFKVKEFCVGDISVNSYAGYLAGIANMSASFYNEDDYSIEVIELAIRIKKAKNKIVFDNTISPRYINDQKPQWVLDDFRGVILPRKGDVVYTKAIDKAFIPTIMKGGQNYDIVKSTIDEILQIENIRGIFKFSK